MAYASVSRLCGKLVVMTEKIRLTQFAAKSG